MFLYQSKELFSQSYKREDNLSKLAIRNFRARDNISQPYITVALSAWATPIMGTGSVNLLPLEPTAADAAAEQTVDWRRDGRRPDDLVYIAMHTVKPAISVQASPILRYQANHLCSTQHVPWPTFESH
jgi:hypothetical protein